MGIKVLAPSEREDRIANALRKKAISVASSIDIEEVSTRLNAPSMGVQSLLERRYWDLQTAFRVAEALELDVVSAMEEAATA
jgi:hypothetical protein